MKRRQRVLGTAALALAIANPFRISLPPYIALMLMCAATLQSATAQGDTPYLEADGWELAPMIVLCPNETITVLTSGVLPAYLNTTYFGGKLIIRLPLWEAIGGHIVSANDREIVYQAPAEEGVYLVYWKGMSPQQRFGFFIKVKADGKGDEILPETTFEGKRGAFLPIARPQNAPVSLFILARDNDPDHRPETSQQRCGFTTNDGYYAVDPPNKPFFPDKRPSCQNNACEEVREDSVQVRGFDRNYGSVSLSGSIAARLRLINIQFTEGMTINIVAAVTRKMYITKVDCYKCENGICKYNGSRVEYLVCEVVNTYVSPMWMCQALMLWDEIRSRDPRPPFDQPLFPDLPLCGKPYQVERDCVSGGDCKCPPKDQPVFTRGCN